MQAGLTESDLRGRRSHMIRSYRVTPLRGATHLAALNAESQILGDIGLTAGQDEAEFGLQRGEVRHAVQWRDEIILDIKIPSSQWTRSSRRLNRLIS